MTPIDKLRSFEARIAALTAEFEDFIEETPYHTIEIGEFEGLSMISDLKQLAERAEDMRELIYPAIGM